MPVCALPWQTASGMCSTERPCQEGTTLKRVAHDANFAVEALLQEGHQQVRPALHPGCPLRAFFELVCERIG